MHTVTSRIELPVRSTSQGTLRVKDWKRIPRTPEMAMTIYTGTWCHGQAGQNSTYISSAPKKMRYDYFIYISLKQPRKNDSKSDCRVCLEETQAPPESKTNTPSRLYLSSQNRSFSEHLILAMGSQNLWFTGAYPTGEPVSLVSLVSQVAFSCWRNAILH